MSSAVNHRQRSHRSEAAHHQAMLAMPKKMSANAFRGFGLPLFGAPPLPAKDHPENLNPLPAPLP